MKSKNQNHKKAKIGYLLIIFIVSTGISIYALRQNNIEAIRLEKQVFVADKNDTNVSGALNTLRKYIYSNMNTNLDSGPNAIYPPIQLKYTYQRLVAQAELQAIVTNNQYAVAANAYCIKQNPNYSLQQKTTCEEQYFESQPSTIPSIPTALYEYDFQSPIWSPDLAGYSLLVSGGSLIAIASVFIHNRTRRFSK